MPAFSDSERIGMCATSSHAATTTSGSPSRSAPTTSDTSPAGPTASSGAPSRATSAIRRPGSSATSRARATGTSNSAPIDARTAFGPYGSALPGPSATLPAPNASAERSAVPTLPGSLTPHSARQTGPAGAWAQRWP